MPDNENFDISSGESTQELEDATVRAEAPRRTQGANHPAQGTNYPQQSANYPQQSANYPQQDGYYAPPQQGYPQQGGYYAPPQQGYPQQRQGVNYPQQGVNYPQQGGYYAPPQGNGYPQQGANYPRQGSYYAPQQPSFAQNAPDGGFRAPERGSAPPPPVDKPQKVKKKSKLGLILGCVGGGVLLGVVATILILVLGGRNAAVAPAHTVEAPREGTAAAEAPAAEGTAEEPAFAVPEPFTVLYGDDETYDAVFGEYYELMQRAYGESDPDRRYMRFAEAEAALLDTGAVQPYSSGGDDDTVTYLIVLNLNRATYSLDNGTAVSPKTQEQKDNTNVAMQSRNFRMALQLAADKSGLVTDESSLRGMYTPPRFVVLSKTVTDDGGHKFNAGTAYGDMVQYYLRSRGSGVKIYDDINGWYDPEAARSCMEAAKLELGYEVSYPVYIDLVYYAPSEVSTSRAEAYKQSVEAALGTNNVIVNLIPTETTDEYYGATFYIDDGASADYDVFFGAGWGPDYDDPQTFLDTFVQKNGEGMLRFVGLYS